MDLSDFTITVVPLEGKVMHADPSTGETVEANEMLIKWKHNSLDVSELDFCLRENHVNWQDKLNMREQQILNTWMEELGYDKNYYIVQDKKIIELNKIESQEQVENWLQPNGTKVVDPVDLEQL